MAAGIAVAAVEAARMRMVFKARMDNMLKDCWV